MVLVSPDTTQADIDQHHSHFRHAVELLFAK